MDFPCEKRIWRMLRYKDRALLTAVFQHGVSYRLLASLMSVSRATVRRRVAWLKALLRDEEVVSALSRAKGHDLYLLQLYFIHGLSARRIANFLNGDEHGQSGKTIGRRLKRIMRDMGCAPAKERRAG